MLLDDQRPEIPGYVSTKEAAEMLGVSTHRMYQYIKAKRLPVVQVGKAFMLPREAVEQFKPNPSGRVRAKAPVWRVYRSRGTLLVTNIHVQVRSGQQKKLLERMKLIQENNKHTFPGTVARYVVRGDDLLRSVNILLIWKDTEMPEEELRQQDLVAFNTELADVLDWTTASYSTNKTIIHT